VSAENREMVVRRAEIVIDELKLQDITPDAFDPNLDFVDELGIDSMDLATVVLVLQDEYNITIDEDDYPKLRNINLIADYISQKKNIPS
jgi:acyl carrier protein